MGRVCAQGVVDSWVVVLRREIKCSAECSVLIEQPGVVVRQLGAEQSQFEVDDVGLLRDGRMCTPCACVTVAETD